MQWLQSQTMDYYNDGVVDAVVAVAVVVVVHQQMEGEASVRTCLSSRHAVLVLWLIATAVAANMAVEHTLLLPHIDELLLLLVPHASMLVSEAS